jgi:hypothetical protein
MEGWRGGCVRYWKDGEVVVLANGRMERGVLLANGRMEKGLC